MGRQAGRQEHHRTRRRALDAFASGRVRCLVGTEMLAYGVDIQGASHVVNADVPASLSSYVHRAGRVGRVGGTRGVVVSLPKNAAELKRLQGYAEELGVTLDLVDPPPPPPEVRPKQAARRKLQGAMRASQEGDAGGAKAAAAGGGAEAAAGAGTDAPVAL